VGWKHDSSSCSSAHHALRPGLGDQPSHGHGAAVNDVSGVQTL
jgi:hypothetical protein